ncbi:hypothetical protein [Demequina sp. NBRC 110056]|uniref:hypothetical protein n=1 Tax=Demequina sp. NBRC 110056 TaxID=1570345 RepID=UPI000A0362A9|nr:hypothetical protein [Demequina sp. NBRC 110056]
MGISREQRAARRLDRDGIGPVLHDRPIGAWPGAVGGFALWGEVLLTGIMVTIASLGVVTAPAALAAGSRHLTRYARSESSRWALFWRDVRAALPGGIGIGAAAAVLATVLAVDISLARTGVLPAAPVVEAISWAGLLAAGTVLLAAAGQWDAHAGWRAAVMRALSQLRGDVGGAAYLASTVAFVGVCTWALPALLVPALGCAAIAVVAIPARPRRRDGEDLA